MWIFAVIAGAAMYAVTNFVDKYILAKEIPDDKAVPMYTGFSSFFIGIVIWIATGFPLLNLHDSAIVIATGILSLWALAIYFKVLSDEETSTIILLFQTTPFIILILSFIFLRETITFIQFIGFVCVLIATTIISLKKTKTRFKLSSAFFFMLAFNLLSAVSAVLMKYAITANSLRKIISYESWGIGIGAVLLYVFIPSIRRAFIQNARIIRKKVLSILILNDIFYIAAKSLTFLAFSLGPIGLVSVLGGTQVFFGILYGWILTLAYPMIFQEKITKKALLQKFTAALLLFEGIVLIS